MTDTARTAASVAEVFPYIDQAVRPQDDFQRHVNGEWLKTAEIPADLDSYGSFIELRDKAELDVRAILEDAAEFATSPSSASDEDETAAIKRRIGAFYASFMDADRAEELGLSPIEDKLAEIQAVQTPEALLRLSARWQRYGMDGILMAGSMRDAGNPERMLWHIGQDGIGLPDESYYREGKFAEIVEAYRSHLTRLLALGRTENPDQAATDVVELERAIAGYHWDVVTTRDAQKRYNLTSGDDVVELMPLITEAFTGWGLEERHTAEIVLMQPDVLPGVQKLLTETDLETWKNWLRVQLLRWAAPLLHSDLVNEHFQFYSKTLAGAEQLKERWKRGVALVNNHLGEDVAQLYVAQHYPPESKQAMDELIEALLKAYRQSISQLPWMGEETRKRALEKLEAFRPMVGHPERWIDYTPVEVDPIDVVGNAARAIEFEWERDLKKIDDGPDPHEWHMTPQTVNAYYHPLENVIVFPAAILQPPFFSPERDMASNFGAIGAVIGHEIGHGFDDQGSRFAGDGSLTDWWTEADRTAFEERTAKLVEQYSGLSPEVAPDHTVNGELTLGENIGDLGGLGIAHKAYTLWLEEKAVDGDYIDGVSGDQRFFYAWAQCWRMIMRPERMVTIITSDPHSPPEFRANQVVKNLDAFHQAFDTQEGDPMYLPPAERVTIW